jgi:hypothetical protein
MTVSAEAKTRPGEASGSPGRTEIDAGCDFARDERLDQRRSAQVTNVM